MGAPVVCLYKYQTPEEVHDSLALAGPGPQAGHDHLVVTVADDPAALPCPAPGIAGHDNRDEFFCGYGQVLRSWPPCDLEP
jgi:hypothetical protein